MIERYSRKEMAFIWSEEARWQRMLKVEILATEAWAKLGIIPKNAATEIKNKASFDIKEILEREKITNHDVIAFVETVSNRCGDSGRWFHYGLTSSDVLDTALALGLRDSCDLILKDIDEIEKELIRLALEHKDTPVVGRTHGIHAEPTSLGLKFCLWLEELRRNRKRLNLARSEINVGKISGAVGTYANIDPFVEKYVCENLSLEIEPVSTQIVQRDRHAFLMSVLAITATFLEKASTEIRNLQRTEIRELEEGFAKGQKGSSAMPHKRNPITAERICGIARVIRGYLTPALEDISLWHERDLTHSSVERIIIPDAFILLDYALNKFCNLLKNLSVYPENAKANLNRMKGLTASGTLLLLLVNKGIKREDAYQMIQRNAMKVWLENKDFKTLLLNDPDVSKVLEKEEIEKVFNYEYYMRHTDEIYKRIGLI